MAGSNIRTITARARHPDAIALDPAIEVAAILVLKEGVECIEEGPSRSARVPGALVRKRLGAEAGKLLAR